MEGWRSWGGASVLASCKLCLIGFINGYPGIMRPLLAGIFLKAVPRRGTPKRGHLLEHRCYYMYVCVCLVCSWVSCEESGDFAPQRHRPFVFCVTHTHNFHSSFRFRSTRATRAGNFQKFCLKHHATPLPVFVVCYTRLLLLLVSQVCFDSIRKSRKLGSYDNTY